MKICKECTHFKNLEKHENGFLIGFCEIEPFDVRTMNSQDMAVQCGHDGGITVGENFGCIHWEKMQTA